MCVCVDFFFLFVFFFCLFFFFFFFFFYLLECLLYVSLCLCVVFVLYSSTSPPPPPPLPHFHHHLLFFFGFLLILPPPSFHYLSTLCLTNSKDTRALSLFFSFPFFFLFSLESISTIPFCWAAHSLPEWHCKWRPPRVYCTLYRCRPSLGSSLPKT